MAQHAEMSPETTSTDDSSAPAESLRKAAHSFFSSGWEGSGRVEACEPPQRLLVRIKDADEADDGRDLEVLLSADGDQTVVVWEQRGMPLELLSAYGAGVQIHVEDLADHLAGRERRDDAKARWDELHPAYQGLAANLS
jgi:hypothetical protein